MVGALIGAVFPLLFALSSIAGVTGALGTLRVTQSHLPTRLQLQTSPPAQLIAKDISDTKIQLNWQGSPDGPAVTYNIYRSFYAGVEPTSNDVDKLIAHGLNKPSYVDSGLAPGYDYYYIVTAVANNKESGCTNEATAHTAGVAHDYPPASNVWCVQNGNQTADIYWTTGTEGTVRYNIYRSDHKGFTPNQSTLIAAAVRGNHYHEVPPTPVGTWWYDIAAVDKSGKIVGTCRDYPIEFRDWGH